MCVCVCISWGVIKFKDLRNSGLLVKLCAHLLSCASYFG